LFSAKAGEASTKGAMPSASKDSLEILFTPRGPSVLLRPLFLPARCYNIS
jgi:hypothetical protein